MIHYLITSLAVVILTPIIFKLIFGYNPYEENKIKSDTFKQNVELMKACTETQECIDTGYEENLLCRSKHRKRLIINKKHLKNFEKMRTWAIKHNEGLQKKHAKIDCEKSRGGLGGLRFIGGTPTKPVVACVSNKCKIQHVSTKDGKYRTRAGEIIQLSIKKIVKQPRGLTPQEIELLIERNKKGIFYCYDREYLRNGKGPIVKFDFKVDIKSNGRVEKTKILGKSLKPKFVECVSNKIKLYLFPRPRISKGNTLQVRLNIKIQ